MPRIELFGPMGVGKTTLYRAALAARTNAPIVLDGPWDVRLELARRLASDGHSIGGAFYKMLLHVPAKRLQKRAVRFFTQRIEKEAFADGAEEWEFFLCDITPVLSPPRKPWARITLESWLLSAVRDAIVFDRYLPDRNILIDEGVVKRSISMHVPRDAGADVPDIIQRIRHIPNNAIFVYLGAERNVVIQRNLMRRDQKRKAKSRVRLAHKPPISESDQLLYWQRQIETSERAVEFLQASGMTVIEVDAERPLPESISYLYSELNRVIGLRRNDQAETSNATTEP